MGQRRTAKPNSKDASQTQAQARQPFDAENVPSHGRRTLDTSPKKDKQALHPPHSSLRALSTAKSLLS